MSHDSYRLEPSRFPQQLELEIPDEIHERLEQLSRQMGRSVRDIAEDLIYLAMAQDSPWLDPCCRGVTDGIQVVPASVEQHRGRVERWIPVTA